MEDSDEELLQIGSARIPHQHKAESSIIDQERDREAMKDIGMDLSDEERERRHVLEFDELERQRCERQRAHAAQIVSTLA